MHTGTVIRVKFPTKITNMRFSDLLAYNLYEMIGDHTCDTCLQNGCLRITRYDFSKTKYLIVNYTTYSTDGSTKIISRISNHTNLRNKIYGMQWKAIAACFHNGINTQSGHYWAYCRKFTNDQWFVYNDDMPVKNAKTLPNDLSNIYGIIYQKIYGTNLDTRTDSDYISCYYYKFKDERVERQKATALKAKSRSNRSEEKAESERSSKREEMGRLRKRRRGEQSANVDELHTSILSNPTPNYVFGMNEDVEEFLLGLMDQICSNCEAKHFKQEPFRSKSNKKTYNLCCNHGSIPSNFKSWEEFPKKLKQMIETNKNLQKELLTIARIINNLYAMACFCSLKHEHKTAGPPSERIYGQTYRTINK